jgi:hypothetical protein
MACPLRIAVVAVSALIALLALYLTFWKSEPDELDKAARAARDGSGDDDDGSGDEDDETETTSKAKMVRKCSRSALHCCCYSADHTASCDLIISAGPAGSCPSMRGIPSTHARVRAAILPLCAGQAVARAHQVSVSAGNPARRCLVPQAVFGGQLAVDRGHPRRGALRSVLRPRRRRDVRGCAWNVFLRPHKRARGAAPRVSRRVCVSCVWECARLHARSPYPGQRE